MKPLLLQFRNQALGFIREPSAAVFNMLVPFLIVLIQAVAFGSDNIGNSLPGYRVVDVLPLNAGVMFPMIIGLFGMGVGLSSMIESRTLAGSSIRPYGVRVVLYAYVLVLIIMVLLGWTASYLTLIMGWQAKLPHNPVATIAVMILTVTMFLMMGACIAAITGTPRSAQGVCSAIFFPLLFLSGAVFPLEAYPPGVQAIAHLLPGFRAHELLTSVWLQNKTIAWGSLIYVIITLLIAGAGARWLLSKREDV